MENNKHRMTLREISEAWRVFNAISPLSFKNPKARHGINRNIDFTEKIHVAIIKTLEEIRNGFIHQDAEGKPKKLFRKVDGEVFKNEQGNSIPIGWDFVENGQQDAQYAQEKYLDEVEEDVNVFKIKTSWLSPAWRYMHNPSGGNAIREEIFMSASEERAIMYALDFEELNENENE
tara:strand:+ start:2385 stop:2912 length:528 start_codon:yes stop_codon:yes gene_type:complete